MPRQPRYEIVGIAQHVIQRGNNRQATFFAKEDYEFYLVCLGDAARKSSCEVHAYVLMTNHVHLLATPGTPRAIARLMQSLGRRYVYYVNQTYRRSGTLWEGRYKASLVGPGRHFFTCSRYIELNPVRAAITAHPDAYPWSSYGRNAWLKADPLVTEHADYTALGSTPQERAEAYRELFPAGIDGDHLRQIRTSTNQCLAYGSERFKEEIEVQLRRRVRPGLVGRPKKGENEREIPV